MTKEKKVTPLMKQYGQIKAQYADAILLFRVGDFYETFGEDAKRAAKVLGIVETKRNNGSASETALAGFPHHALKTYLPKLVKAGCRVAICEQLEEPSKAKKIVRRGVTEMITPGITLGEDLLESQENNYLTAIHLDKQQASLAFVDISTGEFYVTSGDLGYIQSLLDSTSPAEVLVSKDQHTLFETTFGQQFYVYPLNDWLFDASSGERKLLDHFGTKNLKAYSLEGEDDLIMVCGVIIDYLHQSKHPNLGQCQSIHRLYADSRMHLDDFTMRNLEILYSPHVDGKSLFEVINHCVSPMGARKLRSFFTFPLIDKAQIDQRLEQVAVFVEDEPLREKITLLLASLNDIERLGSRIPSNRVTPRDMLKLASASATLQEIKDCLSQSKHTVFKESIARIDPCTALAEEINKTIDPDVPVNWQKGPVIQQGINPALDEWKEIAQNSKAKLEEIRQREADATGISSLKIGFNNVFGYYIEVRNTHKDLVPEDWIRRQTLTGSERYITEELKVFEEKILKASHEIEQLESQLFRQLVDTAQAYVKAWLSTTAVVAELDVYRGFGQLASDKNYCKPTVHTGDAIHIQEGRHPVIEACLPHNETYVPNSVLLDRTSCQIMMITGPNMSGKSAVLRQTALITFLAHIGCYVPAKEADIAITTRIFSRVGASDNLARGESTFMVEMTETARILHQIDDHSLILLDEIGRGTSTFDGVSIAWGLAEYLHKHSSKPKTLFATHYHELNQLADEFERIQNYHIEIKEVKDNILFLRNLIPGGSAHSFGIHVAQLAGIPQELVTRAKTILAQLEGQRSTEDPVVIQQPSAMQLTMFSPEHPGLKKLSETLNELDVDSLTPLDALILIQQWKNDLNK
ncbi:MAG: DNA mismatch repair protein MutS [Chitinophagales bacterium]